MFRKSLALGSLAMIGQSVMIQTSIHNNQCIVEDKAENKFSETVEWSNEHDNNMEIVKTRDSEDADITKLEVCFHSHNRPSYITGRNMIDYRI